VAKTPLWKYGQGDLTLVLIHGGPSLSRYMQTLGNLLRDRYSIVEYQQLGTPENPSDKVSLDDLLKELKKILDECPENRILVGHSWGATLINLYLNDNHEEAIFIDPGPLTTEGASAFSQNLKSRMTPELSRKIEELNSLPENMEKYLELISPLYHMNHSTDSKLGKLEWNYNSFCQIFDEAWERVDTGKLSHRSDILTLHGSHDPIPALSSSIIIPDAGHFPWLENLDGFAQSFDGAVKMLRKKGP